MERQDKRRKEPCRLGASELAQMAVCERRVLLEHRHGKRLTAEQRRAMREGQGVHRRFGVGRPLYAAARESIWVRAVRWLQRLLARLVRGAGGS